MFAAKEEVGMVQEHEINGVLRVGGAFGAGCVWEEPLPVYVISETRWMGSGNYRRGLRPAVVTMGINSSYG